MRYILWPSNTPTKVNIWRVLDFSGLTKSTRQSRNYTKAGFIYCNGNRITLKDLVNIGEVFTLEIRLPNNTIKSETIMLYTQHRDARNNPRSNTPRQLFYKG